MIEVGKTYSLRWKYPHRVEAKVLELHEGYLIANVEHRCNPPCKLLELRATLPIEGRIRYNEKDFWILFDEMADALALPGGR